MSRGLRLVDIELVHDRVTCLRMSAQNSTHRLNVHVGMRTLRASHNVSRFDVTGVESDMELVTIHATTFSDVYTFYVFLLVSRCPWLMT